MAETKKELQLEGNDFTISYDDNGLHLLFPDAWRSDPNAFNSRNQIRELIKDALRTKNIESDWEQREDLPAGQDGYVGTAQYRFSNKRLTPAQAFEQITAYWQAKMAAVEEARLNIDEMTAQQLRELPVKASFVEAEQEKASDIKIREALEDSLKMMVMQTLARSAGGMTLIPLDLVDYVSRGLIDITMEPPKSASIPVPTWRNWLATNGQEELAQQIVTWFKSLSDPSVPEDIQSDAMRLASLPDENLQAMAKQFAGVMGAALSAYRSQTR